MNEALFTGTHGSVYQHENDESKYSVFDTQDKWVADLDDLETAKAAVSLSFYEALKEVNRLRTEMNRIRSASYDACALYGDDEAEDAMRTLAQLIGFPW